MKIIDEYTSKNIIPSINLMEEAGKKISEVIISNFQFKKVLLLCGSKGNGGDALVCGRYLLVI